VAFPQTVQDIKTEIELDGVWTDISTDIRRNPGVTIKRGRANESSNVEASSCELAIDNTSGNYSPRNPTGTYFGVLGRNTPIRVSILSDKSWMPLDTDTGETETQYATAPDIPGLDVTGDIDIRFEADLDSWYDPMELVTKWNSGSNQRAYALYIETGGTLVLATSTNGTTIISHATTVTLPTLYGRQAVRATLDVNNGAAGNTATFYTSDSIDGTWTQLGDTETFSGTTSIFASTAVLRVGGDPDANLGGTAVRGKIYAAEVYNGIAGTQVAAPDFTIQDDADTSFKDQANGSLTGSTATAFNDAATPNLLTCSDADAADIAIGDLVVLTNAGGTYKEQTVFTVTSTASGFGFTNIFYSPDSAVAVVATDVMKEVGNVWTLTGTAISNRDYRARQEVSAWPQEWDTSGNDIYTPIQAGGILRRLGQGQSPVPSPILRTVSAEASLVAYWPAEDGENSTSLASAVPGHQAMSISGTPALANSSPWNASAALPTLNFASFTGSVPVYTSTDNVQVKFFMSIPAAGITNGTVIATVATTGTAARWDLVYGTGGTLTLNAYNASATSILAGGAFGLDVDGRPCYVTMRMLDSGSDVLWSIVTVDAVTGAAVESSPATLSAFQMGRALHLTINPAGTMEDVVMGHFSVQSDSDYFEDTLSSTVLAWAGEVAGQRIKRLCAENSIPFFQMAAIDNTDAMGPQQVGKKLIELLRECADTDMGVLYEPRDLFGLAYRPRLTLNNQPAVVTASYTSGQLAQFKPIDDDQNTANDIKVTRIGGSSYPARDTTSALSVNQPPNGVGIYDQAVPLSMHVDARLPDQAGWRLHLGTVDEARFPVIGFNLTNPSFLTSANLTFDVLSLDIGDRIVVTDMPSHLPPDDVQQIAQGFTEYLANFERTVYVNCTPASPWYIARYSDVLVTVTGGNQSKYGSDGTVTTEALDTTETGIDISTPSGPVWTTTAAQFPLDIIIGGEQITVGGITGTGTAQVMTPCTRSVNGVVKSHASGATVKLLVPAVYGL
jgi:hypothetical protein